LSHQPFNSGYECSFIKSASIYSKTFKIKFNHRLTVWAWVVTWPIGDFKSFFFNRRIGWQHMQDESLTSLLNSRIRSYLVPKTSHCFNSPAGELGVGVLL
jgi:hypothetical protein